METISVSDWTDEDREIFRRLCDRGDEGSDLLVGSLMGDKRDAFCMLKFSRRPRNPFFMAVHVRQELMAFGGLSIVERADTSALEKFSMNQPSVKRDRHCQVGELISSNPIPTGHELLPEFICDVRTKFGPWAWLCPYCTAVFGCGMGPGKGQRYVNDGSLRKVEG